MRNSHNNNIPVNSGKAMPMPKETKGVILRDRDIAKTRLSNFQQNWTRDSFKRFRSSVVSYFQDIYPIATENLELENYDIDLQELKFPSKLPSDYKKISREDVQKWVNYFYELDQIIYDIGITDIAIDKSKEKWGYTLSDQIGATSISKKTGFNLEEEKANLGWIRLQLEFQNIRKALRQDRDMVGVVIGGNRKGKSTLALQVARIVHNGENKGNMPEESIAMGDNGFWKATQELEQYSAIQLDELSGVFYGKDAMTKEQKKRKKRMKTAAKKNQFIIGCGTQFFQIDKEFRTDKVDFCIKVPSRGKFEFYGPKQLEKFEKDDDTGKAITPSPMFTGRFPKLEDQLWDRYQEVEDKKIEEKSLEEGDDEIDLKEVKRQVLNDKEFYINEYNKRRYIDRELVEAEKDLSKNKAKKVKKMAEAELGLPEQVD